MAVKNYCLLVVCIIDSQGMQLVLIQLLVIQ
jgi:hypothetical protein